MSFPRYPKYKDSGVEWLGEVPEHWEVVSLARVTTSKCDGPFGSGLKSEHYTDAGVRVIRLQNIRSNGFDGSDEAFIDADYYASELNGHDVLAGDVLIAGLGDERNTVGRACVAPAEVEPAMVKADCFRFRLHTHRAHPSFIAAVLSAGSAFDAGMLSSGSTRSRIPLSVMATRKFALPTLAEQATVASFLDRETAKIDALIAAQQRLIELLQEKRQAVISHAVTKGLDPDAPMKDSGIEWLGEVPEHWEVVRLRYLCDIQTGSRDTENAVDDGVYPFFVRSETVERINTCAANCEAVFTAGDGAGVGKVFHHYQGPFDFHQRVYMMNNFRQVTGRFLYHYLRANFYKVALEGTAKSTVDSLRRPMFTGFPVSVPPLREQGDLVAAVESEASDFDSLITEAERAITLLQERRSALISAAVTGQIDVRGLAGSEAA